MSMDARLAALWYGTEAERTLEPAVAALGVVYRMNAPLYRLGGGLSFFPDFILPTLGIVIEVDGKEHNQPAKKKADRERTTLMARVHGWRVFRCTNEEALTDPVGTVNGIMEAAGAELRVDPARLSNGVHGMIRIPVLEKYVPPRRARSRKTKRKRKC